MVLYDDVAGVGVDGMIKSSGHYGSLLLFCALIASISARISLMSSFVGRSAFCFSQGNGNH